MDDKRARFEGQVLPHLDAAYRFARWLCRPGEADDVVQDAILRAFRGFDALRGSDAKGVALDHRAQLPFDGGEAATAASICTASRRERCS